MTQDLGPSLCQPHLNHEHAPPHTLLMVLLSDNEPEPKMGLVMGTPRCLDLDALTFKLALPPPKRGPFRARQWASILSDCKQPLIFREGFTLPRDFASMISF